MHIYNVFAKHCSLLTGLSGLGVHICVSMSLNVCLILCVCDRLMKTILSQGIWWKLSVWLSRVPALIPEVPGQEAERAAGLSECLGLGRWEMKFGWGPESSGEQREMNEHMSSQGWIFHTARWPSAFVMLVLDLMMLICKIFSNIFGKTWEIKSHQLIFEGGIWVKTELNFLSWTT